MKNKESVKIEVQINPEINADIQENSLKYNSVHEMLKQWAINPNILIKEDIMGSDSVQTIQRRLSVKERIEAAKASADYFAPKLKSIETKLTSDTSDMSDEELLELAKSLILEDKVIIEGVLIEL